MQGVTRYGEQDDSLLLYRVDGDHARVERDRVACFPPDVTGAFPFSAARLVAEDLLGGFVDVEPIVRGVASIEFDHVLAHHVFRRETKESLHSCVDVADV